MNLPHENTSSTNAGNDSTDNESIHVRCGATQRRSGLKSQDAQDENRLEVKDGVKTGSSEDELAV